MNDSKEMDLFISGIIGVLKKRFSGIGDRDAVEMSVVVMRRDTNRVLTRSSLFARNLDLLVKRYVEGLFKDEP